MLLAIRLGVISLTRVVLISLCFRILLLSILTGLRMANCLAVCLLLRKGAGIGLIANGMMGLLVITFFIDGRLRYSKHCFVLKMAFFYYFFQ